MILPNNKRTKKNPNLDCHTMSDQNKPKPLKNNFSKLYADFIDDFGKVPEKQLLGAMIHNFVEALDFIQYHGLFKDFELWVEDPQLYRIMIKTKKPYLAEEN